MPVYTRTTLKSDILTGLSGSITDTNINVLLNRAVRDVLSDLDIRSSRRKSALSPNLFNDIFQYTCPTDLKGYKIIDVNPQIDRNRYDNWRLTSYEEFERLKEDQRVDYGGEPIRIRKTLWQGENLIALKDNDFTRKLLISKPIDDDSVVLNPLDAVGDWVVFGDGENLTKDSSNYVKGSASLNWDISSAGGTTAGISNASITTYDVTDYLIEGSVFVWAYLSSATDVTNFIIRLGSSASVYYTITVTTDSEGGSFVDGWNLIRFDFVDKSATGTPDDDDMDYIALYMTKDSGKTSETDYRFDNIVMKKGDHYDVIYYSKYLWQNSSGTYIENSTADTDLVNADTEEVNLIELKYMELAERFLKNRTAARENRELYEVDKNTYMLQSPSDALILETTYNFRPNLY